MDSSATAVTRPNYMEKFRCIGGACEDSCCSGWRVVFDKRTAQTYLNAKDPEIREIASKSIKKIKTDRSSQHYSCQRQSKSEPNGSAKCCHFGVGEIAA